MRQSNLLFLILLIIGGLNWGLVGLLGFNLVEAIFGSGTIISRIIYILVGISALVVAATATRRENVARG